MKQLFAKLIKDNKGDYFYVLPNNKGVYKINPNSVNKVNVLHNRLLFSVAAVVVLSSFIKFNFLVMAIMIVVLYAVMSFMLYSQTLPKMTVYQANTFKIEASRKPEDRQRDLLRAFVHIVLGVGLIVTLFFDENPMHIRALIGLFSVFSIVTGINHLVELNKTK